MLCQEPVLHDLWCHHSWLWLSLGLERRVYTLLTPGLWLLQISTSGGPDLTLRQLGMLSVRVTPPGTLDIIKRTIGVCGKMFLSNYLCDVTGGGQWCVETRGWARQQWQARPACEAARATGAGVRGRVRRGESVRVRVSTNLRSKMAAACDLVTRGASDQWQAAVISEASDTLVILTGSSWLSPWAKRRAGAVIGGLGPRRGADRVAGAIRPSMWGPTGWRKHSAKDKQVGAQLVWRGCWCYITTKEATPLTHSLPNTRYLLIKQIVF